MRFGNLRAARTPVHLPFQVRIVLWCFVEIRWAAPKARLIICHGRFILSDTGWMYIFLRVSDACQIMWGHAYVQVWRSLNKLRQMIYIYLFLLMHIYVAYIYIYICTHICIIHMWFSYVRQWGSSPRVNPRTRNNIKAPSAWIVQLTFPGMAFRFNLFVALLLLRCERSLLQTYHFWVSKSPWEMFSQDIWERILSSLDPKSQA